MNGILVTVAVTESVRPTKVAINMPRPSKKEIEARKLEAEIQIFPAWLIEEIDTSAPLTVQAYTAIRRAIIDMILPPGSTVNEKKMCDELNISRTPLREALLRLSEEALVKIIPNQRTTITKIEMETMFEGQLIREALEVKLARLAALRMSPEHEQALDLSLQHQRRAADHQDLHTFFKLDEEFHELISTIGSSPRIWRTIKSGKAHVDRVRHLAYPKQHRLNQILEEHSAIVAAVKARDPDLAHQAMDRHLRNFYTSLQAVMEDDKELFSGEINTLLEQHLLVSQSKP